MRKNYAILLTALVALSIAACGGKGKERPLPAGSVVVALGDSITQGVGASEQSAWPVLLARSSGWRVINAGVSAILVRRLWLVCQHFCENISRHS